MSNAMQQSGGRTSSLNTGTKNTLSNTPILPWYVTFIAGGTSGTIGAVLLNPLEVVKTRFQSSIYNTGPQNTLPINDKWTAIRHIRGTLQSLNSIYTNEGLTALWRGVGATVVGVMPARAIYFSTYTTTKQSLIKYFDHENSLTHLTSALTAGIVTSTATNPIWMVKTRMQLQSSDLKAGKTLLYRNSLHCLQQVTRNEGLRGLYKGLTASYLGVMEGTIQWVLYEHMKKSIKNYKGSDGMTATDYFLTAASSKLVAAITAYPHEVLRTRLREDSGKYRGLYSAALRILREEGVGSFYGGMTAHLMRVVPNSAIMFFSYECLLHFYNQYATIDK